MAGVPGRISPVGPPGRPFLPQRLGPPAEHSGGRLRRRRRVLLVPLMDALCARARPQPFGHHLRELPPRRQHDVEHVRAPSELLTVAVHGRLRIRVFLQHPGYGGARARVDLRLYRLQALDRTAPGAGRRPHLRLLALHRVPVGRSSRPNPDHDGAPVLDRPRPASGRAGEQAVGRRADARRIGLGPTSHGGRSARHGSGRGGYRRVHHLRYERPRHLPVCPLRLQRPSGRRGVIRRDLVAVPRLPVPGPARCKTSTLQTHT